MSDPAEVAVTLGDVTEMARMVLGDDLVGLVIVAQVETEGGNINVAASWPLDNQRKAALMAAEATMIFHQQSQQ